MKSTMESTGGDTQAIARQLRRLAVRALTRMYRSESQAFVFRRRRAAEGDELEGISRRYTSTVLIALAGEDPIIRDRILHGDSAQQVCGRMIRAAERTDDLGEAALALWAARALEHPQASTALDTVRRMNPVGQSYGTVELAWTLTALIAAGSEQVDWPLAGKIARRMLESFNWETGMFPHWPSDASGGRFRSHVTCFADFVYPILAMAEYCRAAECDEAGDAAEQCAERMCSLQGPQGQWWWHFDVRTGKVIEWFPVYAVHQDAMAPMALQALQAACGGRYDDAIARGLQWLVDPPETGRSLVDMDADVIWRKVARREPGKLARGIQAAASRLHRNLRAPGLDLWLRPGFVDYESRPYHMGWILYAWRHSESPLLAADDGGDI